MQMPWGLDGAILSRIRLPVTSRPNWAKDNGTLRVPFRSRHARILLRQGPDDLHFVEPSSLHCPPTPRVGHYPKAAHYGGQITIQCP